MVWIIGGITEAGELAKKIHGTVDYIMTVATEDGKEFFQNLSVIAGRMDFEQMLNFCKEKKITLIADMSHPYAEIVSCNAKKTARSLNIKYIRYIRNTAAESPKQKCRVKHFAGIQELCLFLQKLNSCVFFTTGSKNVADFEKVRGSSRFIYRVLPSPESIGKCREAGIEISCITAMLGPFSKAMNKTMFAEFQAEYVVMKDSGGIGGVKEKLEACSELGITALIIDRPEEADGSTHTLAQIEAQIKKHNSKKLKKRKACSEKQNGLS